MSFSRDLANLQDQIMAYPKSCMRGAARTPGHAGLWQPASVARLHRIPRQTTPPVLSLLTAPSPSFALRDVADLHSLSRLSIACFLFVHPEVNAFTSKSLSLGTAPEISDNSLSCKHVNLGMVARETKSLLPLLNFPECLLEVQHIPPQKMHKTWADI